MNGATVLETFVSLFVQVSLLIGFTAWITSRDRFRANADVCWSALHVAMLTLTVAAFVFPHVRWITWADLQPSQDHPILDSLASISGQICGWGWFSGMALFLAVFASGIIEATRLVRRATIDPTVGKIEQHDALSVSLQNEIETRVSLEDVSPFCWQFHRPVIVVPDILRRFPPAEQVAILRHECAHLRLQHPLHLFLQRLTEAIYWFHPLVWWSSHHAAACREFRCDEDAVRSRDEVAHYLRSMLRLIESKVKPPTTMPAGVGFIGDTSLLSERAHRLGNLTEYSPRSARNAADGVAPLQRHLAPDKSGCFATRDMVTMANVVCAGAERGGH
jgi:bla regulator protein BlaR1